MSEVAHQAGAYPGFCTMKYFYSPLDGMLVHCRVPIYKYTLRWREALWELSVLPTNAMQCPWAQGSNPDLLIQRWVH